jgi:hypothetical protein
MSPERQLGGKPGAMPRIVEVTDNRILQFVSPQRELGGETGGIHRIAQLTGNVAQRDSKFNQ